jgi:phosphohistidine swiveling domain-containing protein
LYTRLRHVALALGERLVDNGLLLRPDDVLFLEMEEAIALARGRMLPATDSLDLVAERREQFTRDLQLNPPDTLVLPVGATWTPEPADAGAEPEGGLAALTGTGACGGRVTGEAAVVLDVADIDRIRGDEILVTRQTDPGWAAVFFLIRGLVIERGGLLSHGAIIAREYGIPAVVGVRDATRLIRDGQQLCVDGSAGRVDRGLG